MIINKTWVIINEAWVISIKAWAIITNLISGRMCKTAANERLFHMHTSVQNLSIRIERRMNFAWLGKVSPTQRLKMI